MADEAKPPERLLDEVRAVIVRMRVLASYVDAFVWNARYCAELVLTLWYLANKQPLPFPPTLDKLLSANPAQKLDRIEKSYFQFLQTHGNAGSHPQTTDLTDQLPAQRTYLDQLRGALKTIRTYWPDEVTSFEKELRRVEDELDRGSAGPAIDWVAERLQLTTTIGGLRSELDSLRAARDREAPPDTAVDKQRLANEARLREEAEQRARRLEIAGLEQKRLAREAERSRAELEQRCDSLQADRAELERRCVSLQADLNRELARRATEEEIERLPSAGAMARSLETRTRDAEGPSARANSPQGMWVVALAFGLGVVGSAVVFAVVQPLLFAGAGPGNATPGAAPAGPALETSASAYASAPDALASPSAATSVESAPTTTAAAASGASPRVEALRISSGGLAWTLKLPFSMVEDRRSDQRVEAAATENMVVRLYACRDDKAQQHIDRAARVIHKDPLSFGITGVESTRLFLETCLFSRQGANGPHVCVRVLHRTGQDTDAADLLKKLGTPEPEK